MRLPVLAAASRRVLAVVSFCLAVSVVGVAPVLADDSVTGPADVTITIGSGLSDRDVRVSVGDVVRFVNRDGERHRMRSRSLAEFDTGDLEPGEAYQVRLSTAGTYLYLDERNDDAAAYRGRIVVAPALGGAGGDSGGSTAAPAGAPAGGGTASGGVASSATVSIGDDFFQPTTIRVAVGGTVTFRNDGGDEHSATSTAFDTGVLGAGASARTTFSAAGSFAFVCMFHSDMRGTIEVAEADGGSTPAPAVPKPAATSAPTPAPAAPGTSGEQAGPAATKASVEIADFSFGPDSVEIAAGGSVTWTNTGVAPHTVTAKDGAFASDMLAPGGTFSRTFATSGTYAYLCAVHPEMIGTVRVVAAGEGRAGVGPGAAGGAVAAPQATPTVAPAAASNPPAAVSVPTSAPEARPDVVATSDVSGLAGIVLAVTLVSVAAALLSRVVRGTVRSPE